MQVRDAIQPYVKALELQVAALVGSGNRVRQIEVLKKKHPEVLTVTPGRFFDMVSENRIHHEQIKQLVIDEADDILESTKLELIANLGKTYQKLVRLHFLERQSHQLRRMLSRYLAVNSC